VIDMNAVFEASPMVRISSPILNISELAEQISLSLEGEHGIEVERINVIDGNQILSSFTGAKS
jgi:hypothetical protein